VVFGAGRSSTSPSGPVVDLMIVGCTRTPPFATVA
jgi:hypothetical protein